MITNIPYSKSSIFNQYIYNSLILLHSPKKSLFNLTFLYIMGLMTYKKVPTSSSSSSSSCSRGFKLNSRRVYVARLRKRFTFFFINIFEKCKFSYSQALHLLGKLVMIHRKNGFIRRNYSSSSSVSSSSSFYGGEEQVKRDNNRVIMMRSSYYNYGLRSNSPFYAEAMADCLEFIKRTSISMDQIEDSALTHIKG